MTIATSADDVRHPADDRGGTCARIYDLSNPDSWDTGMPPAWHVRQRALRELDDRSAGLARQAEQLLSQPDATSALRGIGLAVLALRAELEAQEARRER